MPIAGPIKKPTLALHIVLPVLAGLLMSLSCGGSDPEVVLLDLDGRSGRPPRRDRRPEASVFIFSSVDCPVSNRYAPEVRRLKAEFANQGARFWLVYPNPAETPDAIRQHLKDFGYDFDALRDPEHRLVDLTQASVTPEAAVFASGSRPGLSRPDRRPLCRLWKSPSAPDEARPRGSPAVGPRGRIVHPTLHHGGRMLHLRYEALSP